MQRWAADCTSREMWFMLFFVSCYYCSKPGIQSQHLHMSGNEYSSDGLDVCITY